MVDNAGGTVRVSPPTLGGSPSLQPLILMIAVLAALYVARDVFLPFAIAVLLTFVLQPVVVRLRRLRVPRVLAVIISVLFAFLVMLAVSLVIVLQLNELAREIPTYQSNIITKVRSLKEMGAGNSSIERLSSVVERVGNEISQLNEDDASPAPAEEIQEEPLLVEIFSPQRPIQMLSDLITPIIGPLATSGLVIVVAIFILLDREELRDRFIRLVGYSDLHRTTEALQDAGRRVSQYLLMQLVVNVTYGVPIGIGLWLIGVPNAVLWGLLATILRFLPYIGPVLAAILPLTLALAVAPGWELVLYAAALFLVMELVSNNIVEPLLYGSRTGLSPIAIIISAIFWTWLWGPIGLVLATPLTVCLVVLGRHVPQFEFLKVLLGNDPVLDPKERLYQRLLAGDPDEATDNAEEILEEEYLVDFYGNVAIPALLLGEHDRARGVLLPEQMKQVASSATALLTNLQEIAEEESDEEEASDEAAELNGSKDEAIEPDFPDGEGKRILCIGGRSELDDVSAAMLAQVLEVEGAEAEIATHVQIEPRNLRELAVKGFDTAVIAFLNVNSVGHGRFLVRRLKRASPRLRVGIVLWDGAAEEQEEMVDVARRINADFVAVTMTDTVRKTLADEPSVPLAPVRTLRRRRPVGRSAQAAAAK
jgi:predicted PurR-regulated permease PerM